MAGARENTRVAEAFSSLDRVFSLRGDLVARSPISRLVRVSMDGKNYYVKTYTRGGKHFRRFLGRSRARGEWENLIFFSRMGIPTPPLVAYGQEMRWGVFKRGALITQEEQNTTDLMALSQETPELLANRVWVQTVARQVSGYTKQLHDGGFVHTDLKWRNILVSRGDTPKVYFIDCPLGRKWLRFNLGRGIAKDLACLDAVAEQYLSRTQRLRFYKIYSGYDRMTRYHKQRITAVLNYFAGRK